MAILLCIDTATETAFAGLCNEAGVMICEVHEEQKNHAAFLQPAIRSVMQKSGVSFSQIDAVAVVNGPGSYTGLRVGLASAKGICYATGKPLILLNTLSVMAKAAVDVQKDKDALYCPMIDARRNEVFAAVYDYDLQFVVAPQPVILEPDSFNKQLSVQKMFFFGSGQNKGRKIIRHDNAAFININYSLFHINEMAQPLFIRNQFADVAYAEPNYIKDFYIPVR